MLSTLIILLITAGINAQIDGEFWWLNDKLAEIKGANPEPKFEEVSEFETDEGDKVVFNDDNAADTVRNNDKWHIRFQDHTHLTWPNEREAKSTDIKSTTSKTHTTNGDVLDFKFPDDDNFIWKDIMNTSRHNALPPKNTSETSTTKNKTVLITDKVTFKVYKEETTQVQNICTYLKKGECKGRHGVVYVKRDRQYPKKTPADSQYICCILPLPTDKPSKIYFADDFPVTRFKRSANNGEISTALKQRNALMRRKFPNQNRKIKAPTSLSPTKVTHKIVTPEDDYVDPYANIKNSNFKKPYTPNPYEVTGTKYEYGNQDYVEDYVVELPRPGLVGLYSDHGPGSSWTYVSSGKTDSPYGTVDESNDDVDDEPAPGYSTFDPRLVDRVAIGTSKPPKRRPMKFTTDNSDEISYDSQSHTVNYQAHPDFHVLQGFKLINLVRNTSTIYSRNGRRTSTTEREADSSECVQTRPIMIHSDEDSEYDDVFDVNEHVFGDCGKAVKDPLKECEHDKQIGEADIGSHPWLALAVLTKSPQSILCYASLVHPRAAITAADCVYGSSPGEVTVIAGIWDLEDDSRVRSQQRMAQIHIDSQYKPGNLAHNLAMLHWKRPLKLGVNIHPACVADPHVGDDCKFVGWGGYDQGKHPVLAASEAVLEGFKLFKMLFTPIRERPRWQRTSILTPRQCNEKLSSSNHRITLPSNTFCASIKSRASVTGVGGPLTCNVGDRHSVVGVAVWRDSALVLLPAHEWTIRAIAGLRIR